MTELPAGWALSTVGEVGELRLGKQRSPKWHMGPNMRPYLRVANVFEDRIDISDVKEMHFEPHEVETFELRPGDVLLNEGQTPELLGRPAIYRGELPGACFTNSLIRFRPYDGVLHTWALAVFRWHMHSGRFSRESQITTNIAHLSLGRLAPIEFPVPPLAEQARIVAAIEEQSSRIDQAEALLRSARSRATQLRLTLLDEVVSGDRKRLAVGDVADVISGPAFRSSSFLSEGDGVRLLRGNNIEPGRLRWRGAKLWPAQELSGLEHLLVQSGDVILAMDRPVISTGLKIAIAAPTDAPCLLVQRVARIRPGEAVDARFLFLALKHPTFQRHLLAGQTGTQLPHITLASIRSFEIPVPSLEEQHGLVAEAERRETVLNAVETTIEHALVRAARIRRALLREAVAGRLVSQDAGDEPASELLARLAAERPAASKPRQRKRA